MTRTTFRLATIILGAGLLAISVFYLNRLSEKPPGTGWAPLYLAQPLNAVSDRVEVYVGDVPLKKAVAEGKVNLVQADGTTVPVLESQLTASINNEEQVRVARIPSFIGFGILAGAAGILLVFGLIAPIFKGYVYEADSAILTELHLLHQ